MQRLDDSFDAKVGAAILYLEDVQWLVQILAEGGSEKLQVKLSTDDHTLTIEEVDTLPSYKLRMLRIESPKVNIVIDDRGTRITGNDRTLESWGIGAKVHAAMVKIRRRTTYGNIWKAAACYGVAESIISVAKPPNWLRLIVEVPISIYVIYSGIGMVLLSPYSSSIVLKRKKDAPSFWQKYRDDFGKQFVNYIIFGLLGFLVATVFPYIKHAMNQSPTSTTQPSTQP